ncbi:strictosidine synthase [Hymenobacter sp. M29]|uniref:Strictosidine synthase n=1 Tax=Hymenobacter mellowenesis TaxID=3063995 RepID=A0ABT9A8I6_9BACT|nr:strictosidine synthase [Hymenobacter sp. M29]MDO7846145.1 strictosidine synthase [Hymenobacter sp. M29]
MQKLPKILLTGAALTVAAVVVARATARPKIQKIATSVKSEKHFSSSILLWVRPDKPREATMARWKGPHAKIIAATEGFEQYRQLHFREQNTGLWPATPGVETAIPASRRVDGVAEVTLAGLTSPLKGKAQTKLAYADEVNLFQRTILYAGLPGWSRWYQVAPAGTVVGTRSLVFLRRREGASAAQFRRFIDEELAPALANTGSLKELRTQNFMAWKKSLWDTPNVAHDNAPADQFHASVLLGFADEAAEKAFFSQPLLESLSQRLALFCSAAHAYQLTEAPTFVEHGQNLTAR